MNLDFSAEPLFSWYVVLLLVSGLAMLGIGAVNSACLSAGWRVFNIIAGVGFIGYGVYLGFIFQGSEYIIFFKAFILPVVMIVNFVRSFAARRQAAKASQAPVPFAVYQAGLSTGAGPATPAGATEQAPAQPQPQA